MFSASTYIERRNELKKSVGKGIILINGNSEPPMNYPANTYKFRQDSNFLYFFGPDQPDFAGIIDIDNDLEILFGNDPAIDDIIWMGPQKSMTDIAFECGIKKTKQLNELDGFIKNALEEGRKIHWLPQYRGENILRLSEILRTEPAQINPSASRELITSIIRQRSVKSDEEIEQIEDALDISYEMNTTAMEMSGPGMIEREIFGLIEGFTLSKGNGVSFPVIFSVRGETLHNHRHENIMRNGDLALLDSGAESSLHYASDITRTFPVSGKFSAVQREIYEIVLGSQLRAIELTAPGKKFREVHLETAKYITEGLKACGIMRGNTEDAVMNGAHALFFPHGLGHMLGLDVHDLEGLGETLVGYDENTSRSDQFGLAYLRLAKELLPGFVVTIEPGIYFIPALIDLWKSENKLSEYINYDKLNEYAGFGGIRIEDDILITPNGHRVLGRKPIPKSVADVEEFCSK